MTVRTLLKDNSVHPHATRVMCSGHVKCLLPNALIETILTHETTHVSGLICYSKNDGKLHRSDCSHIARLWNLSTLS